MRVVTVGLALEVDCEENVGVREVERALTGALEGVTLMRAPRDRASAAEFPPDAPAGPVGTVRDVRCVESVEEER